MRTCFMFGHANCPERILPRIEAAIEQLHTRNGVQAFYVGNRGNFDRLATIAAKTVKRRHPELVLRLVLAYHPGERPVVLTEDFDSSFLSTVGEGSQTIRHCQSKPIHGRQGGCVALLCRTFWKHEKFARICAKEAPFENVYKCCR